MKRNVDMARLMRVIVISWTLFLGLGFGAGWIANNYHNQSRESLEKKLSNTDGVLQDTLKKLASARTDGDFYRIKYESGEAPSQLVRVIYRGSLKETASDPGPEEAWQEFELARNNPRDGIIYLSDLGEIAKYAKHDAEVENQVMAYVIDTFGSTEESGSGR